MSRPRPLLGAILLGYLALALLYGAVNPLFEAPDEHMHFFTVRYIAETGRLPFVDPVEPDPLMRQEAAQPPLYYVLGAALVAPVDLANTEEAVWLNPFVLLGDASAPTNLNRVVHGPWESWPWRGYALAAHLLRAFSTLFGLGTLLLIYGAGRLLWPDAERPALLATALVAFLPQFIFLHAAITNDVAVTFFCTATLYLLVRQWRRDRSGVPMQLLIGLVAGLALLSKMAGLLAIPYAAGFVAFLTWREHHWRIRPALLPAFRRIAPILLVAGAVAGWMLIRNWSLYGDVTATSQFIRLEGSRDANLGTVISELGGLWTSFIGVFGWFNVRAPEPIYWLWNGIVLVGVAGAAWRLSRGQLERPWLLLLLSGWFVLVAAGLVNFMLRTPAAQGRLLFPALLPLALGLAWGWSAVPRPAGRAALALAAGAALVVPLRTLPRTYAPPPIITAEEIPATALRLDRSLGHGVTLLAAEIAPGPIRPGETAAMTFYWMRSGPNPREREETPQVVVEIFGYENELVGKLQSYHGGGLYPAPLWPEEAVVASEIGVRLFAEEALTGNALPAAAWIQVRLVDGEGTVVPGVVKAIPAAWAPPEQTIARIGQGIELVAAAPARARAAPGEQLAVNVEWQVTAAPPAGLTTFVHLGLAGAAPLAVGDAVPRAGSYPTALWAAGERFDDRYVLPIPPDLPPGTYPLWIGMYDARGRQPLTVNGQRQPNDAFFIGQVEIGR